MVQATNVSMALPPEYIQRRTQELLNTYFGTTDSPGLITQPRTIPAQEAVALSAPQEALIAAANQAATAITPQSLGIGSFDPFLQTATGQTALAQQALVDAQGVFNPNDPASGISAFMSPFQQNVTEEALKEIDRQGNIARQQAAASAIGAGAFGGGREGVQLSLIHISEPTRRRGRS